jgi:MFS family permease
MSLPGAPPPSGPPAPAAAGGYLWRWLRLPWRAWVYLLHAALLTGSLAMFALVFNLAIVALDIPPFVVFGERVEVLGVLGSLSVGVAALLALPLLWLVNRIGFWWALVLNALLQASSMSIIALAPGVELLLCASALTGIGGVLFQVSAVPFLIRLSDPTTRDHLFSANFAVNIGIAGLGTLIAGELALRFAAWLAVPEGDALAYRAVIAAAGAGLLISVLPLLLIRRRPAPPAAPEAPAAPAMPAAPAAPPAPAPVDRWASFVGRVAPLRRVPQPWYGLLLRPWPLLRLMTPPFLTSCGAALLIPYLNLFFSQQFGVSDDVLGRIFLGLGITAGLAALVGPSISIRIGKMRTIVLTQALSLPFLLLMGFVPLLGVAVAAALLRQGLFNMGSPLYDAFAMEQTDEALRPTVIGAMNGAFAAGYIIMPLISTRIQADYGFAPLFVATGIFYTLAIAANYWLFLRHAGAARVAAEVCQPPA